MAVPPETEAPTCAAGVDFLGFSDALDKQTFEGTGVVGLSALTYYARRGVYYSLVDNGPAASSEARFYTLCLVLGFVPRARRLGLVQHIRAPGQGRVGLSRTGDGARR